MSLLASVSLFVLVVSSRPVLTDSELNVQTSSELEGTVQTTFRIDASKDVHGSDAARIPFLIAEEEQVEDPFRTIASISPLEGHKSSHHTTQPLLELENDELCSNGCTTTNSQVIKLDVASTAERLRDQGETLLNVGIGSTTVPDSGRPHSTVSLLVLALSCIAAFLALACVMLGLYVTKYLVSRMLASERAWDLLPRFRQSAATSSHPDAAAFECEKPSIAAALSVLPGVTQVCSRATDKCALLVEEKAACSDVASDIDSDSDDIDKYQDALDMTPMPTSYDLPPDDANTFTDPPLPEIQHPSVPSPPFQALYRHLDSPLMNEVVSTSSSRPLWSIRASASPPLDLTSSQAASDTAPQSIEHARRRAYRSVPELDIALALQLRPGLGLGADSAWMVRFLMTVFGWFAVALSGQR